MRKKIIFGLCLILILTTTGCADVTNVHDCIPPLEHTYGFWYGVWHGMIQPFSFIVSIFSEEIAVYAINNNGGWYDFGFVFGLGWVIKLIKVLFKLFF